MSLKESTRLKLGPWCSWKSVKHLYVVGRGKLLWKSGEIEPFWSIHLEQNGCHRVSETTRILICEDRDSWVLLRSLLFYLHTPHPPIKKNVYNVATSNPRQPPPPPLGGVRSFAGNPGEPVFYKLLRFTTARAAASPSFTTPFTSSPLRGV